MVDKEKGKDVAKDRQMWSRCGAGSSRDLLKGRSTWLRERQDPSTAIGRQQQEEEARRLMPPPPPPRPRNPTPRPHRSITTIKFRPTGASTTAVMSLPEAPDPVQTRGKGALKDMQRMLTKALLIASDSSACSSSAPRTSAPTPSPALSPQLSGSDPPRRYRLVKITESENGEDDKEEKGATSAGGINIRDPQPPSGEW
ncbi:hypothetical protein V6N13_020326 [Hibiscus sabdariffa]|uniref:Uncharacterized protein n=1 Tax=Hibiscus sabdariffa TaxID=183260 RepID=A0ABR2EX61_9ROSI